VASAETLACFRLLMAAYPDKKTEADTFALYEEMLADIPAYLLEAAIRAHIAASPFFPRIAELRDAARKISGRSHFDALPARPVDHLSAQAVALEDAFYHQGELDAAAWEHLAQLLDRSDRPHRAEGVRNKYRNLSQMRAQET
jgi:hypothetical protein